jgi:hypothetical protein
MVIAEYLPTLSVASLLDSFPITFTDFQAYFSREDVAPLALSLVAIYSIICQAYRHQRYLYLQEMCREVLNEDPKNLPCSSSSISPFYNKYWKILSILSESELNMEFILSLSARGLLSTYAIPTISTLLHSTGGFQRDVKRRFADMVMILNEYGENDLPEPVWATVFPSTDVATASYDDHDRAIRSIFRLNSIHAKYGSRILYQDMMYVLSVFATSPIIWAEGRWGLRAFSADETECLFRYWMNMGDLMNLHPRDEWRSYEDCLKYKRNYERKYMRFEKSNQIVTLATLDFLFSSMKPAFLMQTETVKSWLIELYSAMQESDEHRVALGLPLPRPIFTAIVDAICSFRRFINTYFIPPKPLWYRYRISAKSGRRVTREGMELSDTGAPSCPMTMIYYPIDELEHGNDTYTPYYKPWFWTWLIGRVPPKGYMIENMGPQEIEKGVLTPQPKYAGVQTLKQLFN